MTVNWNWNMKMGVITWNISNTEKVEKVKVNLYKGNCLGVVINDYKDEETKYTIVGTVEADPFNGRISYESLLATSILGAKVGDRITVKTKEPYEVEILSIEN